MKLTKRTFGFCLFIAVIMNEGVCEELFSKDDINNYLRNYYLSEKCPSGIGLKMKNIGVKGCLRSVTYRESSDVVIFDYLLFQSGLNSDDSFDEMDKSNRCESIEKETQALGYTVGKLKYGGLNKPRGAIQFTPVNFISDSKTEKSESALKNWVTEKAVISLTFKHKRKWYVGFINKNGQYEYKESYHSDPKDPVVTPLDFLKE